MALASHDVKKLWAQWPRLAVKDGLLKRRFDEANGYLVIGRSLFQLHCATSLCLLHMEA